MSSTGWRAEYGVADYGIAGIEVGAGTTGHASAVAETAHTNHATVVRHADVVRSARSDHRNMELPLQRAASVIETLPHARSSAADQDHDILDDLERGVGPAAAIRRLAAVRMRATHQLPMSDTPDQHVATGSKRKVSEVMPPTGRRTTARKVTRDSSAEDVSSDESTYSKKTGMSKRKKMVRIVSPDDVINESVGDTQVVNAINIRSRAKRLLSNLPPGHDVPAAQDGRASRGGPAAELPEKESSGRRGRAGRVVESHARDSSIGHSAD